MLISNLSSVLLDFCDVSDNSRTMLIDGRWGSGKTHFIRKFINDNKEFDIIYLSLFGIKSSDEIVLKLSEYLDSSYISQIGSRFIVNSRIDEDDYKKVIIVFDDLERMAEYVAFSEVYGLIDGIKRFGFKVICICNSEEIEKKKDFNGFKEKIFDYIVNVSADKDLFSNIVGLNMTIEETLLKNVNDNWRIIKKAKCIYEIIDSEFKKNNYDFSTYMGYSKEILFHCVILAVQCFFSNNTSEYVFKNDILKMTYELDTKEFGRSIANELYNLFLEGKENTNIKEVVRLFLKAMYHSDYSIITGYAIPSKDDKLFAKYPFDQEIFYLDDDGYVKYKEAFFKYIDEFDFSNNQHLTILKNVISNYYEDLTDVEIRKIIERIALVSDSNEIDMALEEIVIMHGEKVPKLEEWISKLRSEMIKVLKVEKYNLVEQAAREHNYDRLTNILFENRWSAIEKKEEIIAILELYSFGLPNLSEEICNSSWTYCHEIAKFVADTKFKDAFIDYLKQQCLESKSKQLRKRCEALVKYNFNVDVDFD